MGKTLTRDSRLNLKILDRTIKIALKEDRVNKDITSRSLFPKDHTVKAEIVAQEKGILAGLEVVERLFYLLDKNIKFKRLLKDGDWVKRGTKVALMEGSLKKILGGERTALNFLMRLSGIATQTRRFLEKVSPYPVRIMDTRKTTPGLRYLEKYAVRVGGGSNHRMDLSDGILIKDNHLREIRKQKLDIVDLVKKIRKKIGKNIEIEIEAKDIEEFKEALEANPDIILLDNIKIDKIKEIVKIRKNWKKEKLPQLEVSGGVELKNVSQIASTGIERISIGSLTHSYNSIDFSLEII